jgi:hypothetical protein
MALSITELELQSTEYLPSREVMSSLGSAAGAREPGLPALNLPDGGLGLSQLKDGILDVYGKGLFSQLGK